MTLQKGAKLGPYEIQQLIGAGGMGEVYRALDTRLKRTVAIKTIPAALAARTENRRRFETEARAIASLNHPNICALYDIGEVGIAFLVMEYLEGESLAAVLKRGRLPYGEALLHAAHIAEALDEAHRRGVVHADLKPGNMMITAKGIKLLDFGLARLTESASTLLSDDPTVSMTTESAIVGTPQYMSPEQVEARKADFRSDVFSFGSVCYEMLTGKKAFAGETTAALMAAILRADIPVLPADFSPALQHTLRQCWRKSPDQRWQSMADLGREIRWIADNPVNTPVIESQRVSRREILAWGAAAVMGGTAAVAWVGSGRKVNVEPSGVRFSIPEPPGLEMNFFQTAPAISPDGRIIAFFAGNIIRGSIWLHHLDSTEFRELPETEGALNVFWSPDSRALAFFTGDKLKRVSLEGGAAQTICDTPAGTGGSWSASGLIVFQQGMGGMLHQVPIGGGTSTPVMNAVSPHPPPQMLPCFLPDGKTVLFTQVGDDPEKSGLYAIQLGSSEARRILPDAVNARFATSGHLIFGKKDTLRAVSFNPSGLQIQGEPRTIATDVWSFEGASRFDVSATGILVYTQSAPPSSQVEWFDRSGKLEKKLGPIGPFIHMDLSRDEKYAVLERYEDGYGSLWILDLSRDIPTRLTSGSWALQAYWSPDSSEVVYAQATRGTLDIFRRSAVGGPEEKLISLGPVGPSAPTDWSSDGQQIIIGGVTSQGKRDFWVLPVKGEHKLQPYSPSSSQNFQGRLSPDGKWMAYMSTESGTLEIYVAPFPNPTAKWRISTAGGKQPRWRADGKELFYLAPDKTLMAVSMPSPDRASLPTSLFRTKAIEYFFGLRSDYAPSKDGQRFLVQTGDSQIQSISVITGWRNSLP